MCMLYYTNPNCSLGHTTSSSHSGPIHVNASAAVLTAQPSQNQRFAARSTKTSQYTAATSAAPSRSRSRAKNASGRHHGQKITSSHDRGRAMAPVPAADADAAAALLRWPTHTRSAAAATSRASWCVWWKSVPLLVMRAIASW